jgi:hypothetical protein
MASTVDPDPVMKVDRMDDRGCIGWIAKAAKVDRTSAPGCPQLNLAAEPRGLGAFSPKGSCRAVPGQRDAHRQRGQLTVKSSSPVL